MVEHLNLGCYDIIKEGFINLDLTSNMADIKMDMREYEPKEKVAFVEAAYSLGFLEEPMKMIDKICSWIENGGEFRFIVKDKIGSEIFLAENEDKREALTKGRKLYGEGVERRHLFDKEFLKEYFKGKFAVTCTNRTGGIDVCFHLVKLPKVFIAKRIFWITGKGCTGKSTLIKNLIGKKSKKIYHRTEYGMVVGKYDTSKNKTGIEAYSKGLRKKRIMIAAGMSETVIFEATPWQKDEYLPIKKWAKENGIEFTTIILDSPTELCLERARIRKDTEKNISYFQNNAKFVDGISGAIHLDSSCEEEELLSGLKVFLDLKPKAF